jgi:hypothetical protein
MTTKNKKNNLALFQYWGIIDEDYSCDLVATNVDTGVKFNVNGNKMIDESLNADQFDEVEKVTKTQLAEKLIQSINAPITVVFTKQSGQKRTMRGRLVSSEDVLGRSYVEDLDVKDDNRLRQVDHRTLESLIVRGVKYVLK